MEPIQNQRLHHRVAAESLWRDGDPWVRDLNRWLPFVKWFLAIPHLIVLVVLNLATVVEVAGAWVAILVTGRYPRDCSGSWRASFAGIVASSATRSPS